MMAIAANGGTPDGGEKTRLLLADLWRRNRPVIEDRLTILDRAAASDPLPGDLRAAALDVSHKLSGSLGMFGFEQGTVIARELELLLDTPQPDTSRLADLTKQLRALILPAS